MTAPRWLKLRWPSRANSGTLPRLGAVARRQKPTWRRSKNLYDACATIATEHILVFDRGFDGPTSAETGVITGVELEGPAYAAGLREGMKRLGRDGVIDGDSRVEIGYRVIDDKGSERVIHYYPADKLQVTIQQFRVAPGLSASHLTVFARLISGGA